MGKSKHNFKFNTVIIGLLISMILSMFVQLVWIDKGKSLFGNVKFHSIKSMMIATGYDVNGESYVTRNNDPQFQLENIDSGISSIRIGFSKPLAKDMMIQIFYATAGQSLTEVNSVVYNSKKGLKQAIIEIPFDKYSLLRVDIGDSAGQAFELSDIEVSTTKIGFLEKFKSQINIQKTIGLFVIFFLLFWLYERYKEKIPGDPRNTLNYAFVVFCFTMFTLWAVVQPYNSCPDEYMRYDVIKYVFDYNKLPHGGDPLILNKLWGISYAFLPYLSGIVSAAFMKIIGVFTMNEQALILAARMAVVCFGTLTVYYVIKIGDKCFKGEYKWLFVLLVCCLPQFVFLSSYMNNDMLALLAITMMIFYWIEGHESKWRIKHCVGLSIGVSFSLLSYYNSYTFILISVVFFIGSNLYHKVDKATLVKKFVFISLIVIALSGWWFVRNAVIYNGDFLGIKTANFYSNKYAVEGVKQMNRMTPQKQGVSLPFMLVDMGWLKTTYQSFIGCFGYMSIRLYNWMYLFYTGIILMGIVTFLAKFIRMVKQKDYKYIFFLCMIGAAALNVLLSVFNSYTADYQPQGRYIIGCLVPLMFMVTYGIEYLMDLLKCKSQVYGKTAIISICVFCIFTSIICYSFIIVPAYR